MLRRLTGAETSPRSMATHGRIWRDFRSSLLVMISPIRPKISKTSVQFDFTCIARIE